MRNLCLRGLALIAFAAAPCIVTPVLAGSPYYDEPDMARAAPTVPAPQVSRRAGHFSCSMHEVHTKLERKNCR